MISISKTQNKNLAFAGISSFSSKNCYFPYLRNDPNVVAPKSLLELIKCFDNFVDRGSRYFNVAFDSNKNKLYLGRHYCYSQRVDLLELDIKNMTEESLGYSITVKGANWAGTVKKMNEYHGTEYAKMSEDKSTLIIDKTDHTEFKALLQVVARLNTTINMCEHNGLNNHEDYKNCLERFAQTSRANSEDTLKITTHALDEAQKYFKSALVKTKFVEDISKHQIDHCCSQFKYNNYTDDKNFELSYSVVFQILKSGLASGCAAPQATIVVKYKVVNGKASWKVFDDVMYTGVWSNESDREIKISDDFHVVIYDNRNGGRAAIETKGYVNYLKLILERSGDFKKVRDTIVKTFKL